MTSIVSGFSPVVKHRCQYQTEGVSQSFVYLFYCTAEKLKSRYERDPNRSFAISIIIPDLMFIHPASVHCIPAYCTSVRARLDRAFWEPATLLVGMSWASQKCTRNNKSFTETKPEGSNTSPIVYRSSADCCRSVDCPSLPTHEPTDETLLSWIRL